MYQTYAVNLLELFCLKQENRLFQEIVHLVVVLFVEEFILFVFVCIFFFWSSCLEAALWTTAFMTVEHVFKRNLTRLTKIFNCFPLLFFIIYSQYFFSRRESALVHPHCWDPLSLTMENMCLATTFPRCEVYASNYVSGVFSSIFTLDDFRNWPQGPLGGCLITACIDLSSFLTMTSMIESWLYNS